MTDDDRPIYQIVEVATLEGLAGSLRQKEQLHQQQAATQAQMIRACIAAIKQTTEQAARRLQQERCAEQRAGKRYRPVRFHEPQQKVTRDRNLAFLHLEWLATQLEDQTVR
jgi:hypothetical protein